MNNVENCQLMCSEAFYYCISFKLISGKICSPLIFFMPHDYFSLFQNKRRIQKLKNSISVGDTTIPLASILCSAIFFSGENIQINRFFALVFYLDTFSQKFCKTSAKQMQNRPLQFLMSTASKPKTCKFNKKVSL